MSGALLLQRGPLAQQPQYPAPVDTSTPLARGLVGAFHPAAGNGSPVSGAYLNVAGAGRGFATSSASQYWSASSNAIVSSSPTWTILTVLTGTPTAAGSGGMAFYCERPNGTQIVKLGFGDAAGTTAADFVVRDLSSNIVFLRSSANVQTNTGPRVLVGVRRASNDHRLFVNGLLSGSDTSTNVNGAFGASASVIGNDLQDTTSYLNGASVPLVLLWNRALSDAEIAAVSANPWQIFKAPRPRLWLAAASSSSAVLVGANSTQANSGEIGRAHV